MLILGILVYALAMVGANLIVAAFGPWVMPINSFVLIGLDLTMRDWLQLRLRTWHMAILIVVTGALTYLLNPAAGMIAVASSVAFMCAALVDWATFSAMHGSWFRRSNGSNLVGAGVDSLLFPTIAFGGFDPAIVAAQFAAKVAGGFCWSFVLQHWAKDAQPMPLIGP